MRLILEYGYFYVSLGRKCGPTKESYPFLNSSHFYVMEMLPSCAVQIFKAHESVITLARYTMFAWIGGYLRILSCENVSWPWVQSATDTGSKNYRHECQHIRV
jgi:hypothetical protein